MIKMCVGFHVKCRYFCHILKKLEFSRQIFEKYSNIKFHENPCSGSRVDGCGLTGRRTDRHNEAFRNFANALNKITVGYIFLVGEWPQTADIKGRVTLSHCHVARNIVTLSRQISSCRIVTLSRHVTVPNGHVVKLSCCKIVTLSNCHVANCHLVKLSRFHVVKLSNCHVVTLLVTLSSCQIVTLLNCHVVKLSHF
jgi:hypothetical protein